MCPPKMPVMGVWTKSAWRVTEVLFRGPTCSHSSSLPSPGSSCSSSFTEWLLGPLEIVSSEKQTICLGYYIHINTKNKNKRRFYTSHLHRSVNCSVRVNSGWVVHWGQMQWHDAPVSLLIWPGTDDTRGHLEHAGGMGMQTLPRNRSQAPSLSRGLRVPGKSPLPQGTHVLPGEVN